MTANATLQAYWRETGGNPAPFLQPGIAVLEIEQRYRVRLPEDFKSYLSTLAPMEDFWDAGDITWWSPSRLKNVPDEYDHPVGDASMAAAAH